MLYQFEMMCLENAKSSACSQSVPSLTESSRTVTSACSDHGSAALSALNAGSGDDVRRAAGHTRLEVRLRDRSGMPIDCLRMQGPAEPETETNKSPTHN